MFGINHQQPSPAVARADAQERRSAQRHKAFKGARLTFNSGFGSYECVVRNLSESGARLAFGDASCIPPDFDLAISGSAARPVQVRWRTMTAVGVAFA